MGLIQPGMKPMLDVKNTEGFKKAMALVTFLERLGISKDATLYAQVKITHQHISSVMNALYKVPHYPGISREERVVEFLPNMVAFAIVAAFYSTVLYFTLSWFIR